MKLAMEYTGKTFLEVATMIDGMTGNLTPESIKPDLSPEKRRDILRDTYKATVPVTPGDVVHKYLASRGIDELVYPPTLRFASALRDGEGGSRPAMVAMVGVYGQEKYVSMHRTFLKSDGSGKAEMASPRKIMPGELPDGSCVMLSEYTGGALGIAEGIETAMSASALFSMPVWAALNTALLARWVPPEGCDEVAIFGDRDPKFGGQKAAYALAYRLAVNGTRVTVQFPDKMGTDFNDVYLERVGL
jgi:putative DNA primase/helicase